MHNHFFFRAFFLLLFTVCHAAIGGELKKDYFGATKPGDWISQELTSHDGSKSSYLSQRLPDEDGRAVVELTIKALAGAGEGSESKNIVHMPGDFNFARDWLSYGKFTEKMSMEYSGMVMPIDDATLEIIRDSSKDYRGIVTFSGTETIDGYACDRYTYTSAVAGPNPQQEHGELWLNDTVPFGVVRQSAKTVTADGTVVSSYDIRMTDKGHEAADEVVESPVSESETPATPIEVSFMEGYQSELFALEITTVANTSGHKLEIVLRSKTERDVLVHIEAGDWDIPGDLPVEMLLITMGQATNLLLPAMENSPSITVTQRGTYGPVEGSFALSYYEGTAYFTGSVTVDSLDK